MSTTHIYIIRHGQSEGNLKNLFLGHTDLDLTELGHKQAELTAEYLDKVHIDVIYSSDLLRAYNTGKHTADKKGLPIIKDKRLREIYAGEWEGKSFDELIDKYPDEYMNVWRKNIGCARCNGGESVAELRKRFSACVAELAMKNEGKSICIFSHATPIRAIRAEMEGVSLEDMKNVPWAANASVTHIVMENGDFHMLEYGINDFLGDLATQLTSKV